MTVIKFTRHVARYRKAMKDRIARRIEQLQQEKEEIRIGAILRDKELDGQIQALKEVLTAIENERPEQELAHVGS